MIPILFNASKHNNSEGLGRLTDAITCIVEEERNGIYELKMQYPVTGQHYSDNAPRYQIVTTAFKGSGKQAFRVYKISKPLDGIVTINARHISYDLRNIVVNPFTASSCAQALSNLKSAMQVQNDFTFWTNKTVNANFSLKHPENTRSILGGQAGSILDVYGTGEYEFDNYDVKLWLHRGLDKGVTIRYGKNLTDIKASLDSGDAYTTIVPYWVSQDGATVVNGDPVYSEHETEVAGFSTVAMDFSGDFTEAPTKAQLMTRAAKYLEDNRPWELKENLTVSFVALADTEEYKDIASLETVNLCDTVHIYHPKLGITATAKVVKTKWDSLRERYTEIELGTPKTSLAQAIKPVTKTDLTNQAVQTSNFLLDSMAELISALVGEAGGHIIFKREADGHVSAIYAMDTDDEATATNVLRINYMGIYGSSNGINGDYGLAITTDGRINASKILFGVLQGIEIIAETGQIGEYEITSSGLQKEVTIDGVRYRVVLRPPNTNSGVNTWIISTQYYDEERQGWYAKGYISANGNAYFDGNLEVHGTSVQVGNETHRGSVWWYGAENHSGTETHSGNAEVTGKVNLRNHENMLAGNKLYFYNPMTVSIDGSGSNSTTAEWAYDYDKYGNAIRTFAWGKEGTQTTEIGTIKRSNAIISTSCTSSWTDVTTIDLTPGTWLIRYGCMFEGVGGLTLALLSDGVNHRASGYAPDGNSYNINAMDIYVCTADITITMQSWSSMLTGFRNPYLRAIKIR